MQNCRGDLLVKYYCKLMRHLFFHREGFHSLPIPTSTSVRRWALGPLAGVAKQKEKLISFCYRKLGSICYGRQGLPRQGVRMPLDARHLSAGYAASQQKAKLPSHTLLQLAYHGISNYWRCRIASLSGSTLISRAHRP